MYNGYFSTRNLKVNTNILNLPQESKMPGLFEVYKLYWYSGWGFFFVWGSFFFSFLMFFCGVFFSLHNTTHPTDLVQYSFNCKCLYPHLPFLAQQGFKFPNNICSVRYSVHTCPEFERMICSTLTTVRLHNQVYAVILIYAEVPLFITWGGVFFASFKQILVLAETF